jgi:hypothetical protein
MARTRSSSREGSRCSCRSVGTAAIRSGSPGPLCSGVAKLSFVKRAQAHATSLVALSVPPAVEPAE